MATVAETRPADNGRLGPADHGRPMTLEAFEAGAFEDGFQYELIDGRLYVSPQPNAPQGLVDNWIFRALLRYSDRRPDILNFVYNRARVFVPGRPGVTTPEPAVAAYRDFPVDLPFRMVRWQDTSPILVVEVLSLDDPDKDLVRNVELYFQVPSIREYWLLDARDPDRPGLCARIRHGRRWRVVNRAFDETYTTRLLPDFTLTVNPHR